MARSNRAEYPAGSLVKTLEGELDQDHLDNERETPAGTWGWIAATPSMKGYDGYDLLFPNGAWVIPDHGELSNRMLYLVLTPEEVARDLQRNSNLKD